MCSVSASKVEYSFGDNKNQQFRTPIKRKKVDNSVLTKKKGTRKSRGIHGYWLTCEPDQPNPTQ